MPITALWQEPILYVIISMIASGSILMAPHRSSAARVLQLSIWHIERSEGDSPSFY